jgi:regulator of RNase E activity RraB
MEPNWITYPLEMAADKPGLCTVDLAWAEEQDAERSHCLVVRVTLKDPGDDGFGVESERDRLSEAEEAFDESMSDDHGAQLVAVVRGAGTCDFWFYVAPEQAEAASATAQRALSDWSPIVNVVSDPEWEAYRENLLPDADQLRTGRDMEMMSELEAAGDDASKPRDIVHVAYFSDAQTRDKFVARAQQNKFQLVDKTQFEHEGETIHVARVSRHSALEPDAISEAGALLDELAEALGGEYDGWESPVVP